MSYKVNEKNPINVTLSQRKPTVALSLVFLHLNTRTVPIYLLPLHVSQHGHQYTSLTTSSMPLYSYMILVIKGGPHVLTTTINIMKGVVIKWGCQIQRGHESLNWISGQKSLCWPVGNTQCACLQWRAVRVILGPHNIASNIKRHNIRYSIFYFSYREELQCNLTACMCIYRCNQSSKRD